MSSSVSRPIFLATKATLSYTNIITLLNVVESMVLCCMLCREIFGSECVQLETLRNLASKHKLSNANFDLAYSLTNLLNNYTTPL